MKNESELTVNEKPIYARLFNIKYTFESAQPLTFYGDYYANESKLNYVEGDSLIKLRFKELKGNNTKIMIDNPNSWKLGKVYTKFRLDDDVSMLYKKISTDENMERAISAYKGMRVTLNDPWETTVCFITSQFNNVKRIRLIIKNLVNMFGEEHIDESTGIKFKSFPNPEKLSRVSKEDLLRSGMGFRAKYIMDAARVCSENIDLSKLNPKNYDELKGTLMDIEGVGPKVADCIILMGYGNFNAFPIDVWMKRTLERLYFNSKPQKIKDLYKFSEEKWGEYRGFAQQYLFFYGMKNLGRGNKDGK
ncbi:3-methyladenine DNA glycosylase/8-oxoguanine DNA glycosylase [Candidatus Mancarchaeum acidiphilum]|uniref:DNA-(apurinic or apyrimidinic site) lyase n=1 Tax=Candidatus Mancarchaeum acidiphilum TaxID=1920749 RepID=A0A218NNI2_9ARCH|nr:DNA glycosylase [Candidatus Mancarchaeum acidiphilum]ASI14013.1 3-methyladenine DNA glycosylase/8-oxoguanine DNA glycosylase [Candidatus Mancarchaeum acidiphilum]